MILVKERQYYYAENMEFLTGLGIIYTEFIGQIATRQINLVNGIYYSSSSLQDYHPDVGYLLYDGLKDDLDLSHSIRITENEFETIWSNTVLRQDKERYLHYHFGNAAIPIHSSMLIIHIVNKLGKWGKGFVLALSGNYPEAKKSYLAWSKDLQTFLLGNVDFCEVDPDEKIYVGNMLAQEGIKRHKNDKELYVQYDQLKECLLKVADFALINRLEVQCPLIGAGLGGGDWNIISEMILDTICYKKINCHVIRLDS